jgi:hypothetical protein
VAKLLRSRKQFGRCRVEGHGDNWRCEPIAELQSTPFTRAQDKREAREEIEAELRGYIEGSQNLDIEIATLINSNFSKLI